MIFKLPPPMPFRIHLKAHVIGVAAGLLLLIPAETAYANTVWQGLVFEPRGYWLIPATLAVEAAVLHKLLKSTVRQACLTAFVMNVVSYFLGAWLQMPTLYHPDRPGMGLGYLVSVAIIGNIVIESWVVRGLHRQTPIWRIVRYVGPVNLATVSVTLAYLYILYH